MRVSEKTSKLQRYAEAGDMACRRYFLPEKDADAEKLVARADLFLGIFSSSDICGQRSDDLFEVVGDCLKL